jgi:hypothetical protein
VYVEVLGQPIVILGSLKATTELFERRGANCSDRPQLWMMKLCVSPIARMSDADGFRAPPFVATTTTTIFTALRARCRIAVALAGRSAACVTATPGVSAGRRSTPPTSPTKCWRTSRATPLTPHSLCASLSARACAAFAAAADVPLMRM